MGEISKTHNFDLEHRSLLFAKRVRLFIKRLPRTIANIEDAKQVVRSSGSIGANYIEANESLGKKDFIMRIRISRKEAKETIYWLNLFETGTDKPLDTERQNLIQEATELMLILSAIMRKSV